ncbi:MAG: hypothetical protein JWN11_1361 [Hyphomicrobiales bacterium]|nr:hypothetical protein [Hyphomicrobiales bacterium]
MKPILKVSAAVLIAAISTFPAVAATAPAMAPAAKTVAAKPAVAKAAPAKVAAVAPAKAAPAKAVAKAAPLTFKKIDANHDGKVSEAELKAVSPKLTKAEFATADSDKSGALSLAEVAKYFKAHTAKK